jgi:hypothetical protein
MVTRLLFEELSSYRKRNVVLQIKRESHVSDETGVNVKCVVYSTRRNKKKRKGKMKQKKKLKRKGKIEDLRKQKRKKEKRTTKIKE